VTNGLDTLTDTHRASQAAEQLLATLVSIRPTGGGATSQTLLREEQMLSRIARRFHLPEEKLRTRLTAMRREARKRVGMGVSGTAPPTGELTVSTRLAEMPALDRSLLELVFLNPSIIARLRPPIEPTALESEAGRRIYAVCCHLVDDGWQNDFGRLLAAFDHADMKSLLVQLDESCQTKAKTDRERWLADLLDAFRRRGEEKTERRRLAVAREDASEAEQLLAQFCEQSKSKHLNEYERRKK
jgi:hypothetical protein